MADFQSDAFVFFGATGDLAHKQIFPSLQGLICDEGFNLPIVGVAKAGWNLDQLKARAKDSLEKHGGLDQDAFNKLTGLLRYVDGDYSDPNCRLNPRWPRPGSVRRCLFLTLLTRLVVSSLAIAGR